jgi:ankyrin repeat protein
MRDKKPIGPLERKLMALLNSERFDEADALLGQGGIDLNAEVERGIPMISRFTSIGHIEAVSWLLEKGARPDSALYGVSPVFYSAREGDLGIVENLYAHGADLNQPGPGGMTPVFAAAWNGHREVFARLIELGADTSVLDKEGRDCFKIASMSPKIGPDFVASLRETKLEFVARETVNAHVEEAAPEVVEIAARASTRKRF